MWRRLVTAQGLGSAARTAAARQVSTSHSRSVGIPLVIDNDGRTERVYDIYSRLLKDRIVCVMAPVSFLPIC